MALDRFNAELSLAIRVAKHEGEGRIALIFDLWHQPFVQNELPQEWVNLGQKLHPADQTRLQQIFALWLDEKDISDVTLNRAVEVQAPVEMGAGKQAVDEDEVNEQQPVVFIEERRVEALFKRMSKPEEKAMRIADSLKNIHERYYVIRMMLENLLKVSGLNRVLVSQLMLLRSENSNSLLEGFLRSHKGSELEALRRRDFFSSLPMEHFIGIFQHINFLLEKEAREEEARKPTVFAQMMERGRTFFKLFGARKTKPVVEVVAETKKSLG